MNKNLCFILLCSCALVPFPQAHGSVFYVDSQNPAASDSNPGTLLLPWKTIRKATATVVAGDTVTVQPGEYNEFVTNTTSGSAASPITFTGVRGSAGEWLTIIDPSITISNGWVAAPEIGTGVYKLTGVSFDPKEVSINHKRLAFVYSMGDISGYLSAAYTSPSLTNIMTLATNVNLTLSQSGATVKSWDGVEAAFGTAGSGPYTIYLRLRDGSNPNGLNIRAAPNRDGHQDTTVYQPAVNLQNKSYITFSNFLVRGSFAQFNLDGSNCHDNTVVSNYISGGLYGAIISNGAHNNAVQNNSATADYYGYSDMGSWDTGSSSKAYGYCVRESIYLFSKWIMGQSSSFDYRIHLLVAGNTNVVSGNYVYQGIGVGIEAWNPNPSTPAYQTNTQIYSNTVAAMPSVGILLSEGITDTRVHDNLISDANLNVRFHHLDFDPDNGRVVYFYRNRSWLPNGVGDHTFTYFGSSSGATVFPTFWIYHNSFSGGMGCLRDNGYAYGNGGLKNFHYINNIFSDAYYFDPNSIVSGFWTTASMIGTFDYNEVTPPYLGSPGGTHAAWFGVHNIGSTTNQWTSTPNGSFALPLGSQANGTAIDTSTAWTDGGSYPALPDTAAKVGSAWDIGALEHGSLLLPASLLHVINN